MVSEVGRLLDAWADSLWPRPSKSDISRRVGVSRSTVGPPQRGDHPAFVFRSLLAQRGVAGIPARPPPDQPLLLCSDAATILHHRFVELSKSAGNFRPPLHRQDTIRHGPERAAEELDQIDQLMIVVFRQRIDQWH